MDYFEEIERLITDDSADFHESTKIIEKLIENDEEYVFKLMEVGMSHFSEKKMNHAKAFTTSLIFTQYPDKLRILLYCIIMDICDLTTKKCLFKNLDKYNPIQSIFQSEPELFNCIRNGEDDLELINYSSLKYLINELYQFNRTYLNLDGLLKPELVNYFVQKYGKLFANKHVFVRINPHHVPENAKIRLEEEVLKPANPKWIQNLNLYNYEKTGSSYFLPDDVHPTEEQKYWEKNLCKINRLEVSAKRDGSGNFSMMLEELCEEYLDYGVLFGRCIHLDSLDPVGTNLEQVKLKHIDLAINVYHADIIDDRMNCNLANGDKVTKASKRCHLLRADNVDFKDLLVMAESFFKSESLTKEWISDQFR